jgi:hypothetical protein
VATWLFSGGAASFDPHGNRIKRRPIDFPVLAVGNSNGATSRTQLWTYDRKLGCQAIGFIERDVRILEDHTTLISELFADNEIKIKIRHTNRLQFQLMQKSTIERSVP